MCMLLRYPSVEMKPPMATIPCKVAIASMATFSNFRPAVNSVGLTERHVTTGIVMKAKVKTVKAKTDIKRSKLMRIR